MRGHIGHAGLLLPFLKVVQIGAHSWEQVTRRYLAHWVSKGFEIKDLLPAILLQRRRCTLTEQGRLEVDGGDYRLYLW